MEYKKHYDSLIESRQELRRNKKLGDGLENHHVLPKSLGGTNLSDNLVLLTPREHYIAHWLLYKSLSGRDKAKMAYAFFSMCRSNNSQKRTVTARQYEIAKKAISVSCSGKLHPGFGVNPFTDAQIEEIRTRQTGNGNSMFGKEPWNKGKPGLSPSLETRKKISESLAGRSLSEETKLKISKSHKGKILSNDTKEKLRQANLGKIRSAESIEKTASKLRGKKQKVIKCPHCGKSGGTTMYRWHFDNCKQQ